MNTIIDELQINKSETEELSIEREYRFLLVITDYQNMKTIGNNLRKLLKHEFPKIKFSVRKDYYDAYSVEWYDGPSVAQIRETAELFINSVYNRMVERYFLLLRQSIK